MYVSRLVAVLGTLTVTSATTSAAVVDDLSHKALEALRASTVEPEALQSEGCFILNANVRKDW
jgi:hypothetical protein